MIPTKTQCLDAARFYLGDDVTSGGQVFTDTRLEQPFNMAYRELFRALQGLQNPRVRREAYYNLPANTSVLLPSTASIADMGEVEALDERGNVTAVSITGAVTGAGFATITAAGHPFVTGDQAVIYGIVGLTGLSGIFTVTVSSSSVFLANGAVVAGSYLSGGTASRSGEQFMPVLDAGRIEGYSTSNSVLGVYAWYEDAFHFPPCASLRQLRIGYISSAATIAAVGDTTGIDDSLDFLAIRTAGLAAASRGARERSEVLNSLALGPTLQADGSGGILRELVAAGVRALQSNPVRRPPFREQRNYIDIL